MKKVQGLFLFLALLLMGYSATLHAEDTDIYVDNSTNAGVPNVLFVMDNGANFSASANGTGCAVYGDGTGDVPSLGSAKASSILQCALVNAINALPDGVVNIGLVVSNANNFGETQATTDTTKGGFHDKCNSSALGGCVIRKLKLMNTANKASLIKFIKGWSDSGTTGVDSFNVKVNTATPATMMQEAWAYYNGATGMSNEVYSSSILATGCQRNFIVYISNTEKDPANESNPSPSAALAAAQVGATAAQLVGITGNVKFSPAVCGSTTSYALATGNNYADEWSRLMYQKDGGATGNENVQNIISYSIGILGPTNKCSTETLGMLSSIAQVGGGKFFQTSNTSDLTTALTAVLNEVQAVNSVFSSASLPVSVNAEGSYLNQIYLGMFRPDASGNPRWMGNLKQYKLVPNSSGATVLGDAAGNPAISSAGTGFISPNAVSYWTKKNTAAVPDSGGGFWVNDKKGVPESGFDSPDGEVVEKGGVAQQLRLESLTADYAATNQSTSNPRRLYTYCPSGSSCVAALTDSTNAFSTANAGISSAAFGDTTTVPVASIVRTGTTALVTTTGNHGFSTGTTVTISNATQSQYNVTQAITANTSTTFTITGLPDYPTTPSAGTYTIAKSSLSSTPVASITRHTTTSGFSIDTETATVTTSGSHGFTSGQNVTISNVTPTNYGTGTSITVVDATHFTFPVTVFPPALATNTYKVQVSASQYPAVSVNLAKFTTNVVVGTTTAAHGFWVGQKVKITTSTAPAASAYFANGNAGVGTVAITAVGAGSSPTTFTYALSGLGNPASASGTVISDPTQVTLTSVKRSGTNVTASATGATAPDYFFGSASGKTRVVDLSSTGSGSNESAYLSSVTSVTITCADATCSSFTWPITTTPAVSATASNAATSMTVGLSPASESLLAGEITRTTGTTTATASVLNLVANKFANGDVVNITASGTALDSETAYVGTWTLSCTGTCTTATFGPVPLTPTTPATGSNIQAFSSTSSPDKSTVVRWVRGEDSQGDEKGPGGTVKVRPSIHGDVLHSRPLVINYGDSRGIVVYYGANDGVYRAVNGNQTAAISGVPAGGELWGLILKEHYGILNRLRTNSPEIKFPSTLLASAKAKDYFVDGATGAYQKLNADGSINTAYIYLTMRRGGRVMYAVDVSTPTAPVVKWKIDPTTTGFEELGQTWSRPRVTLLQRDAGSTPTPVLIFGAGYDPAEDTEPPGTDSMGRGIYMVNALTGALIWSATPSCTASSTCANVPEMKYAIPSDITFVDRDENGYTDKLYFGDLGGNMWRADISAASSSSWSVTRLAALGCATGACASGTTPRKFFFPPSVLTVYPSGASGSFDAVSLASGDREHPLRSSATGSSYNVADKFFMIMDTGTTVGATATANVTPTTLFNATSTEYDGTLNGFYRNFATGEKGVNAPLAVNGLVFFATNRPTDPTGTCSANLGEARGYAVSPFLGTASSNILAGGGLAPSAVAGIITIETTNDDGSKTVSEEKFCIGCAVECTGTTCSALENSPPPGKVPKNMKRTYWYRK